MAKPSFN